MLFFVVCACFALFPEAVLRGAQGGLALCINAVVPSLLPFMLLSSCVIKSNFSRPLGAALSKILSPLTGISQSGCVCFITGLFGGYGAGARAVYECYKQKQISKKEAERLLAFCNNAGPLFIMGTVGIGFFSSKSVGAVLFLVQIVTALICARVFSGNFGRKTMNILDEWSFYKKNKPSLGELVTSSAIESAGAIINACVFVITFSAILEILPFGQYPFLAGILEVTRGTAELSRLGTQAYPLVSALIAWGGMSVHFQADALTGGAFSTKTYYLGRVFAGIIAFLLTHAVYADIYILFLVVTVIIALYLIGLTIKSFFFPKYTRQHESRQRQHS